MRVLRPIGYQPDVPRSLQRPPRHWLRLAAAIGCALAITACGGSGGTSTNAGGGRADFLAFSECMRAHGVSDFPDPSGQGGIKIPVGSNFNPFSPATRAAQAQCRKKLPGGGPPQGVSEQQKEQLVKTSECMRAHGVSGFPDPTTTPPSSPNGYSTIEGLGGPNGGLYLLIPNTIDVNSPAFKAASKACSFQ
jgi:hypothetical protein